MPRYEAVLFDWMLTLADYPDDRQLLRRAHAVLGRTVNGGALEAKIVRLREAGRDEDVLEASLREDCSPELHRAGAMLQFQRAGIDDELAAAMYALIGDPTFHPVYPETRAVLEGLGERGVRVAVVSDIHVDLRKHAELAGIGHLVDIWILSYEHGIQKPNTAIFRLALDALGVAASSALMVGDRASHDGAASGIGIDTLIIPGRGRTEAARSRKLLAVLDVVGD